MLESISVAGGILVALGVVLVVHGGRRRVPDLAAALAHLRPGPPTPTAAAGGVGIGGLRLGRFVTPPTRDLEMLGKSPDTYLRDKLLWGAVGFVLPAAWLRLHIFLDVGVLGSVGAGIVCAIGGFLLVDVNIRGQAATARAEFRHAIATYLTLVAMVRLAGHGAVESLEAASVPCRGWIFDRVRGALAAARASNEAPWHALKDLSAEIGVPDLGDLGDIMSLAGEQGAQVYTTLLARAASLRSAMRTTERKKAATITSLLYVPTTLILLVFMVLIGYPALSQITG